jgi:hypothetical protein
MDRSTVFTKTAKGITQVNQKSASLSKDLMKVLKVIDGKSNLGQIMEKVEMDKGPTEIAINKLVKDGFARIFETRKEEADPFASEGDDDFDFTAPGKAPAATQRVVASAANDISALVAQQKAIDDQKKAATHAHEAAKAKAKSEAEARARAEAEAKAKAEAEQRAMEQARKAREASEKAKAELEAKMREEEVRQRAVAEAKAKLAAQQKAKEEEESKRLAEMRARAQAEADAKARAELEAKLREEEAKRKAAAELVARAAAETKVKEEAEARALAEMRAKAEREAKALAEARAKAEAEAQALAKARVEAEAAAKRKAEEAASAEKEMKARLKEEIEGRIRAEMEELLRNELEEKTRAEMEAQILAEARLAAKAELEERLREEREALARAEAEARAKADSDAKTRADAEAKLRAEAEARARVEAEGRIKAEEELKKARAQVDRARAEAEVRAREIEAKSREVEAKAREQEEIAKRLEVERRAKIEAQARAQVEAEERERRERELQDTIDAERKAKADAEMRAKIEAKARETVEADTRARVQAELETDMVKRAELEGKAQAKAYMEAKAQAELEEDAKMRAEQERKAREIAEILRTKVDADEAPPDAAPAKKRYRRKRSIVGPLIFAFIGALVIGVIALHLVPLRGYGGKIERTMSGWLHDDVSISALKFTLFPTPHLKVEGLAVGKQLDARAVNGRIYMDLPTLFGDRPAIHSIELDNVTLSNEAVRRIFTWGSTEGKEGQITSIKLNGVTLDVTPKIDPFNANLTFTKQGALERASLSGPTGWSLVLTPAAEKGMDLEFNARNWLLPGLGVPLTVATLSMKGTLDSSQLMVPEFEAVAMEGKVNGTLRATWGNGVKLESELALSRLQADQLMGAFTRNIAVTGKLDGNFSVTAEAPSADALFASPSVKGKFKLSEGSISNVDLVAVMQSDTAGQRAGVTKFAEMTGEFAASEQRSSYRQVNLQGGVLRGNGSFDVVSNGGALSGRASLEIRSQVAQDRGAFSISGTVSRPIIKRGG